MFYSSSQSNRTGFVRGLSDRPQSLSSGFNRVERILKTLFVRRLYLWPRFQVCLLPLSLISPPMSPLIIINTKLRGLYQFLSDSIWFLGMHGIVSDIASYCTGTCRIVLDSFSPIRLHQIMLYCIIWDCIRLNPSKSDCITSYQIVSVASNGTSWIVSYRIVSY